MARMNTAAVADLSYPIGKFQYEGPYSTERRSGFIEDIHAAPERLRAAVHGLNDKQLNTPYRPEGWTVRQVAHHVPDSHMNAFIRFKLALTEDTPLVKPYDETRWAELADVQVPIETSLVLLEKLTERWVAVLRAMHADDFGRKLRHPELGEINLHFLLGMYAWHGRHHVAHITSLRERMGW
jgi:hypothetical protein